MEAVRVGAPSSNAPLQHGLGEYEATQCDLAFPATMLGRELEASLTSSLRALAGEDSPTLRAMLGIEPATAGAHSEEALLYFNLSPLLGCV